MPKRTLGHATRLIAWRGRAHCVGLDGFGIEVRELEDECAGAMGVAALEFEEADAWEGVLGRDTALFARVFHHDVAQGLDNGRKKIERGETDAQGCGQLGGGDGLKTVFGSDEGGEATNGGAPLEGDVAEGHFNGRNVLDELLDPGGIEREAGWRGLSHHALQYTDIGRFVNGFYTVFESILESQRKVLGNRGLNAKVAMGAKEDGGGGRRGQERRVELVDARSMRVEQASG